MIGKQCTNRNFAKVVLLISAIILTIQVLCVYLQNSNSVTEFTYINSIKSGVIVNAVGGLGNQLFRYACSYALARKRNIPLYLVIPDNMNTESKEGREKIQRDPAARIFALDQFNIPLNNTITSRIHYSDSDTFKFNDSDLLSQETKIPTDKLLIHDDYCQSELFFKDYKNEIQQQFVQKQVNTQRFQYWIDLIEGDEKIMNNKNKSFISIAIHIRRGDVHNKAYWPTPMTFFDTAMRIMMKKFEGIRRFRYFVFSDDIKFVQENLLQNFTGNELANVQIYYVSSSCYTEKNTTAKPIRVECASNRNFSLTSLEEFYLMTICSHIIVSNSTFSWWAAYLNKNKDKIVIAPKFHKKFFEHYKENRKFKEFIINQHWYPKEWIVLDPYNQN